MHPDDARHASAPPRRASLVPFSSLPDFRLAAGEPDIRGWRLVDADARVLGVIEELLIDERTDEVAALAVRPEGGRDASLRAVGMQDVRLDERGRRVVSDIDAAAFDALPAGGGVGTAPGVTVEHTADGGSVIRVPIVEEQLVVERRPVVREVLVIRKRAVERQQVVEADLRRERVDVDQRDVRGDPRDGPHRDRRP